MKKGTKITSITSGDKWEWDEIPIVKNRTKGAKPYLNVSASFDIESTSFYDKGDKRAIMYAWVFTFNGRVWTGRTWEEWIILLYKFKRHYGVDKDECRFPIYIHNLAFESEFLLHRFKWVEIFALQERRPIKMLTEEGYEFRCSYLLSGYGLATVGKNLKKYKVEKLVGDLDYSLIRHSKTPLSDKEWGYIVNDGLVVSAYIQELIEEYKSVAKIPMTKTGFVREYCRNACYYGSRSHSSDFSGKFRNYSSLMKRLTLEGAKEYMLLREAFQGGFTHASMYASGRVYENVTSYDFTSSYPAVMVCEEFPMGKGQWVKPKDKKEFLTFLKTRCCVFEIEFRHLEAKTHIDNPLSFSRCTICEGYEVDNGRIVRADKVRTTITNLDYEVFKKFYHWKSSSVGEMLVYRKAYLPTDLVKAILNLYRDKTKLKGVEDELSKARYMWAKEFLNSVYGMAVTAIVRGKIRLDQTRYEWYEEAPKYESEIKEYNENPKRFLFYPWGVFVTAYARRNLFSGLLAVGEDYIYSDTDSIKFTNADKHARYFKWYNALAKRKLKKASEYHHIPLEYFSPKTVKGEEKPLGVWDYDGFYTRFKTLGAKRYLVEYAEPHEVTKGIMSRYSLTISGVNKKTAIPALEKKSREEGKDIFDLFEFGLYFDPTMCGKNLHTYIDVEQKGFVKDYLGIESDYFEYSSVHLEPTGYLMESTPDYLRILGQIREGHYIE